VLAGGRRQLCGRASRRLAHTNTRAVRGLANWAAHSHTVCNYRAEVAASLLPASGQNKGGPKTGSPSSQHLRLLLISWARLSGRLSVLVSGLPLATLDGKLHARVPSLREKRRCVFNRGQSWRRKWAQLEWGCLVGGGKRSDKKSIKGHVGSLSGGPKDREMNWDLLVARGDR